MNGWTVLVALIPLVVAVKLIRHILAPKPEFPIEPGPWFTSYINDWGRAHGIPQWELNERATSAIIAGTNGFIWTTETPEWDREWFNKRGYDFPRRWLPFSALENYYGVPGEVVRLDA